jgi:hypothetical protein
MSFGKFLASPIGSALRVLVALVIGSFVAWLGAGHSVADVSLSDFWTWLGAALVVALPIVVAALNPSDPRFGKTNL